VNHIFELIKVENYREATCPKCGSVCTVKGSKVTYKSAFGRYLNKVPPCIPNHLKEAQERPKEQPVGLDEKEILLRLVNDEILPLMTFKKNSIAGNIAEKLKRQIGEYK